jgi:hypothetical protein
MMGSTHRLPSFEQHLADLIPAASVPLKFAGLRDPKKGAARKAPTGCRQMTAERHHEWSQNGSVYLRDVR